MTHPDEGPYRLSKGGNVALADLGAELGSVTVLLETGSADGAAVDADVSVLLLGQDGKVRSNDDLVFYNQPVALSGAVHLREKLLGSAEDGQAISTDRLSLDLDEVPDEVHKIVLAASLDPALGLTFGRASFVRLRLQRASDAHDLCEYSIAGPTTETALIFGELYRRAERWRLRAVGQGYDQGLAALIADFGVEVDEHPSAGEAEGTDPASSTSTSDEHVGSAPPDEAQGASGVPGETPGRVSIRRSSVKPPRMPSDWNTSVPTADGTDFKPARLFPVAGIGSGEEQERRAASALLALLPLVRDFGRAVLAPLGAPAGTVATFVEVPFGLGEQAYRPDGLVRVARGSRTWTALIEVKTSSEVLDAAQIETYLDIARQEKFDAVVTISNEISGPDGDHPVSVDRRKLRKVALHHLSWDEVRAHLILLTRHRPIADTTQRVVLTEFLRYMEHERSGLHGFTDMGKRWVTARDSVRASTARAGDRAISEVCAGFDQLMQHTALRLTGILGVEVTALLRRNAPDVATRCEQLAGTGLLFGVLRVPGAAEVLIVRADIRTDRVACTVEIPAPREGRPATRINWLLRQLTEAKDTVRCEAFTSGPRPESAAALLGAVRIDPTLLLPTDGREIRGFRVIRETPLGTKRGTGRGSFISSILDGTENFYAEVMQHLRPWTARPPQVPAASQSMPAPDARRQAI